MYRGVFCGLTLNRFPMWIQSALSLSLSVLHSVENSALGIMYSRYLVIVYKADSRYIDAIDSNPNPNLCFVLNTVA